MSQKLIKHGDSLALIIDKSLLDSLKIDEKTELNISVINNSLIIKSSEKFESDDNKKKLQNKDVLDVAKRMMDKYEKTFKALSKT